MCMHNAHVDKLVFPLLFCLCVSLIYRVTSGESKVVEEKQFFKRIKSLVHFDLEDLGPVPDPAT